MKNLIYLCEGTLDDMENVGIFPDFVIGKNYELVKLYIGYDYDLDTNDFVKCENSFGYYIDENDYDKISFNNIILLHSFTLDIDPDSQLFRTFIDRMRFEASPAPKNKQLLH